MTLIKQLPWTMVWVSLPLQLSNTSVQLVWRESVKQLGTTPQKSFKQGKSWQRPCINIQHEKKVVNWVKEKRIILIRYVSLHQTGSSLLHEWLFTGHTQRSVGVFIGVGQRRFYCKYMNMCSTTDLAAKCVSYHHKCMQHLKEKDMKLHTAFERERQKLSWKSSDVKNLVLKCHILT